MTELQAVNVMLRAIGSSTVSSMDVGLPDVANARETLREQNKLVQARGWWFNTEYGVVYQPNSTTKEISIGRDVEKLEQPSTVVSKRGTKLFNMETNSYQFDTPVKFQKVVRILPWENIDDSVQRAVLYGAVVQFVEDEVGDKGKAEKWERKAMQAYSQLVSNDLASAGHNVLDRQRILRARAGVRPYNRGRINRWR